MMFRKKKADTNIAKGLENVKSRVNESDKKLKSAYALPRTVGTVTVKLAYIIILP
jgi:hypothetical protein